MILLILYRPRSTSPGFNGIGILYYSIIFRRKIDEKLPNQLLVICSDCLLYYIVNG